MYVDPEHHHTTSSKFDQNKQSSTMRVLAKGSFQKKKRRNIWNFPYVFLLSKNDFWLILRLFIFSPLKYQKYLEKFYNSAKRVVVEGGGGVIREKNKSV